MKFLDETPVGIIRPRDDQRTRGSFVEPVHDSRPCRAANRGKLPEAIEQGADQRSARFSGARMHYDSGGLIDDGEVIVFVENLQRNRFRSDGERLGRRNFNFYFFSGFDAMRRLRGDAVDVHSAPGDEFLKARSAEIGRMSREITIEPHA